MDQQSPHHCQIPESLPLQLGSRCNSISPKFDYPECLIHGSSLTFFDPVLKLRVCPLCASVGPYRHHQCIPIACMEAITTIKQVSFQTDDFFDLSLLPEVIRLVKATELSDSESKDSPLTLAKARIPKEVSAVISTFITSKFKILVDSEADLSAQILAANPNLNEKKIRQYISLVLKHKELVLAAISGSTSLSQNSSLEEISNCEDTKASVTSSSSNISSDAEFLELKEAYNSQHFNFQGMKVKVTPYSNKVLPGVYNHQYALIEILIGKKSESEMQSRPSFSLAIALDVSGSMSGLSINNAKQACIDVVSAMEKGDTIHLIVWEAKLLHQNGKYVDKEVMIAKIRGIRAYGGTNMFEGLREAARALNQDETNHTKRIFLFSDGMVNEGLIQKHEDMFNYVSSLRSQHNITVSSFGIGTHFDEKMMNGIAKIGSGNYFFIDQFENIPKIVEKGLKGLQRIVCSDMIMKIQALGGVVVTKKGSDFEAIDVGNGIMLGDGREKEFKHVLLNIGINQSSAKAGPFTAFTWELSYKKMDNVIAEGPICGKLEFEGDHLMFSDEVVNDDTLVFMTIHECSDLDKQLSSQLTKHDYDAAIVTKQAVVDSLAAVSSKDKMGFSRVLLIKAKKRLEELKQLKSGRANKSYITKAVYQDMRTLFFARVYWTTSLIAAIAVDEADEDMGYSLFD